MEAWREELYRSQGRFLGNELYHEGAKGQKWGVRRYQNPDGTLTALGRVHYGVGDPRVPLGKARTRKEKKNAAAAAGATKIRAGDPEARQKYAVERAVGKFHKAVADAEKAYQDEQDIQREEDIARFERADGVQRAMNEIDRERRYAEAKAKNDRRQAEEDEYLRDRERRYAEAKAKNDRRQAEEDERARRKAEEDARAAVKKEDDDVIDGEFREIRRGSDTRGRSDSSDGDSKKEVDNVKDTNSTSKKMKDSNKDNADSGNSSSGGKKKKDKKGKKDDNNEESDETSSDGKTEQQRRLEQLKQTRDAYADAGTYYNKGGNSFDLAGRTMDNSIESYRKYLSNQTWTRKSEKEIANMSNDEFKALVTRMDLERQYSSLTANDALRGRQMASNLLRDFGTVAYAAGGVANTAAALYSLKMKYKGGNN